MTLVTGVGCAVGHFAAVHVYERLCAPLTPMGFVLSPFVVDTPHCSALRWVIHHGACGIRDCWAAFAAVCIAASVSGAWRAWSTPKTE